MRLQTVRTCQLIFTGFLALGLTHCGPQGYESSSLNSRSYTGHETPEGKKYVVGKEERLEEEKIKIIPYLPVDGTPIKMTPEETKKVEFHKTLKEFRFLRYENEASSAVRMGGDRYTLEVVLDGDNKKLLTFSGPLIKNSSKFQFTGIAKEDSSYSISGEIEDMNGRVEGTIVFSHNGSGQKEEATILYRAYEANLNVRTPEDKNLEEHVNLFKRIENLRNNTKAWVNTFSVPYGASTFDVAIIHKSVARPPVKQNETEEEDQLEALLKFSGRSVETGLPDLPDEKVEISEEAKDQNLESITLVGNAEGEDSKIFSVAMIDDNGEKTEILMDVEREKTAEEIKEENERKEELRENFLFDPVFDSEDISAPTKNSQEQELPDGDDIPIPTPRPDYTPSPSPVTPSRDSAKPSQTSLGNNERSYMYVRSGSNALKIISDFERNFYLNGVQREINKIKNSRPKTNQLKAFFKYANPFRGMIEAIAKTYGVPPQYAYVALIESAYFYGGKYKIEVAPTTTASGPFQFVIDTARGLGMRVDRSQRKGTLPSRSDERRYFAPSACAAAKYFRNNAKMFHRDATLSITGYYRGENRINSLAKRYGYSFAELAKHNVEKTAIEYTNKKLAAYFLAGKYEGSHLDVDSESPKQLPSSTVFPSQAIKDSTCRNAVQ